MAAAEELYAEFIEVAPVAGQVEAHMPCERQESVLDIDFHAHIDAGRTTFIFDAEGTFVQQGGWKVDEALQTKVDDAKVYAERRGITLDIFITTNKSVKDDADLWQLQAWAEQIGATQLFTPMSPEERKPGPYMMYQVLRYMELKYPGRYVGAENCVVVDDKLSAGIAAANYAGMYSIWVDRLGQTDLMGDKLLRRVPEKLFFAHHGTRATQPGPTPYDPAMAARYSKITEYEAKVQTPEYMVAGASLVNGYGSERITLTDDQLGRLRPSVVGAIRDPIRKALEDMPGSQLVDAYKRLVSEHGVVMGNTATLCRPVLTVTGEVLYSKGYKKLGAACFIAAVISDFWDGKWARGQKDVDMNDPMRKKIGIAEANFDKFLELVSGQRLVREGGKKSKGTYIAQTAREVWRTAVERPYAKRHGFDGRATSASRIGTAVVNTATILALLDAPDPLTKTLDIIGTGEKFGCSEVVTHEWRRAELRKAIGRAVARQAVDTGTLRTLDIRLKPEEFKNLKAGVWKHAAAA